MGAMVNRKNNVVVMDCTLYYVEQSVETGRLVVIFHLFI